VFAGYETGMTIFLALLARASNCREEERLTGATKWFNSTGPSIEK